MKGVYSPEYFQVTISRRELDTVLWLLDKMDAEFELRAEEQDVIVQLHVVREKREA